MAICASHGCNELPSFKKKGDMQNSTGIKRKKPSKKTAGRLSRKEVLFEIDERVCSEIKKENDPVVVIDSKSKIVLWNNAAKTLFGYSEKEAIGRDLNIVIPEEYHRLNKYRIRMMVQTGVSEFPKKPIELVAKTKNNSEVIVEIYPSMLSTKEGIFFSFIFRDITNKSHRGTIKDNQKISPSRVDSGSRRDFEKTVSMAGKYLSADFAVYQKISDTFLYSEAGWKAPDDFEKERKKRGTVCYDIIKKNKRMPSLIHDLDKNVFAETDPTIKRNSLKTVLGLPVRNGKKAIGVLCVFYHINRKPDENELRTFTLLAQAIEDRETHIRTVEKLAQNERKLGIADINLGRLSRQILLYREEERKNISVNLHDEVGSMVVSLSSGLTIAKEEIKDGNLEEALAQIIQVKKKLDNAVDNIKNIAIELRPPDLDIIGLKGVLEEYFVNIQEQSKVKIYFTFALSGSGLNDTLSTALYRFIQESINNSIKHASANTISIVLRTAGNSITLEISDDGRGFNSDELRQGNTPKKIGLWGMKMRVQALGGAFSIESQVCRGTKIVIDLPLREESN